MYNTVPGLELYFEGTKFISHLPKFWTAVNREIHQNIFADMIKILIKGCSRRSRNQQNKNSRNISISFFYSVTRVFATTERLLPGHDRSAPLLKFLIVVIINISNRISPSANLTNWVRPLYYRVYSLQKSENQGSDSYRVELT